MADKLENLNKKELLALAAERGIDLPPGAKKREILALLKKPKVAPTIDVTITPGAESQAEPIPEPPNPIVFIACSGCKRMVEPDMTRACPYCPDNRVFCPNCAKAGTCHKCGEALSK